MKTQEIADFLSAELVGDDSLEIHGIAGLNSALKGEIAFVAKSGVSFESEASCLIVPLYFTAQTPQPQLRVSNPKLAFSLVAKKLKKYEPRYFGKNALIVADSADVRTAAIGAFVTIGENSYVGEGCEIGDGVRIGKNVIIKESTIVHQNCVIYDNVEIGYDCIIHAGTIIGSDGFGYVTDENGDHHQFPQVGNVVIEDKVEIGANCCIDRGSLGTTHIGEGTKIDNMVHLAHNVHIGKRVLIAAETGISGSTVIEDNCIIGGQVGMGDHARVLSGAVIGSQAGVLPGKIVRPGVWWGTPVQPLAEYKRQNAHVKGLQRLKDDVKELKKLSKER